MGGFGFDKLNDIFKTATFAEMRNFVIDCCGLMREDWKSKNESLPNLENEIRNELTFSYLRDSTIKTRLGYDNLKLSFDAEVAESYDPITLKTMGRVDIKVTNEDTLIHNERYYTIECKRLDGSKTFNKSYVTQGVSRFVSSDAKYPSAYGKNIMLGFVVRQLDIKQNTQKINELQNSELEIGTVTKEMSMIEEKGSHCIYEAEYNSPFGVVVLQHLFYDFSAIMIRSCYDE